MSDTKRFLLWVSLVAWGFFSLVVPVHAECWEMPYSTYLNNQSPECDIPLEVAANTIVVKKKAVDSAAPVAGCSTERDNVWGATGNTVSMNNASRVYVGTKFVAGASATICKIHIMMQRVGDLTGRTLSACIYNDDGGAGLEADPTTAIDCSDTISANDVDTVAEEEVIFSSGISAAITETTLWVVVIMGGAAPDASNYISLKTTDTTVEHIVSDADGSGTWADEASTKGVKFRLFSNG